MHGLYHMITKCSGPALEALLRARLRRGKEDSARQNERRGQSNRPRPPGRLLWVHAASVGEAQSTLILVNRLLMARPELHIMVTSGTVTSAALMGQKLPTRAFHQYIPLDHPRWTEDFLTHWRPDCVLWLESELWPNMLAGIRARRIPAILLNARLSPRSFSRWRWFGAFAAEVLSTFGVILCQSADEARRFSALGACETIVCDNLKYSASPLSFDRDALHILSGATNGRPLWLYASTHKGEEAIACRVHLKLKEDFPDLLTIIVPRHPDRRAEIDQICSGFPLNVALRGDGKKPPAADDDVYIADTLGELGLFYRLAPMAMIGRSFSDDGGGGHNPIEAAQLSCAVLHGPHIQNLETIYADMTQAKAVQAVQDEADLAQTLRVLLRDEDRLKSLQLAGLHFTRSKAGAVDSILSNILRVAGQSLNPQTKQGGSP